MKNKLFAIIIGLNIALLLHSCKQYELPKGFPEEDEFAKIIADVHFAEATINQARLGSRDNDSVTNSYYHHVLANYHLTQEKFDTIVNWYLAHPELYQDVYEKSIAILSEREANWQREIKKIEEERSLIEKEKRARNIWHLKKNYFVNLKDTFDRQLPFGIKVDTIDNASGYKFSAYYQFLKDNQVQESILELVTLNEDSILDTISYKLLNTHISTRAELTIGVNEDKKILKMYGLLIKHDTLKEIRARIKNIEFNTSLSKIQCL